MKKILSLLHESNLGWIEGKFASDCSLEDILEAEKHANDGVPVSDNGFLRLVLEYKGEIVALVEIPFTKEVFSGSKPVIFTSKKCILLNDRFGFEITLFFDRDYPYLNLGWGMFKAYIPLSEVSEDSGLQKYIADIFGKHPEKVTVFDKMN